MEASQQLIDEILDVIQTSQYPAKTLQKNSKYAHLNDYILAWTSHMPDIQYNARVFYAINQLTSYYICSREGCNNELRHDIKFHPLAGPVSKHCCSRCAASDPKTVQIRRQKSIARCGYPSAQSTLEYRKTLSDKLQSLPDEHWQAALEKRIKTCNRLYGVDSISQVKEIKDKAVMSFKNRPEEVKKKQFEHSIQVKMQKYGDCSHGKKISETKQRFSSQKKASINRKRKKTLLKDYGVDCLLVIPENKKKSLLTRRKVEYQSFLDNAFVEPQFTMQEFIANPYAIFPWKCRHCGKTLHSKRQHRYILRQIAPVRCLDCYPIYGNQSKSETEVFNYIKGIYDGLVVQRDRSIISPKELDIYVPQVNIAIEYNGVAWHSLQYGTEETYHLIKTEMCHDIGIFLLHIFDIEWIYHRHQTEAVIARLLGISQQKVDAMQCTFSRLNCAEAQQFYSKNSFMQYKHSQMSYGFRHGDELVLCLQGDIIRGKLVLHDMWMKMGIDVSNAFKAICQNFSHMYKHVQMLVDRRIWPLTMFDSIYNVDISFSKPNIWHVVKCNRSYLINCINEDDDKSLLYTLHDSGNIVIDVQ